MTLFFISFIATFVFLAARNSRRKQRQREVIRSIEAIKEAATRQKIAEAEERRAAIRQREAERTEEKARKARSAARAAAEKKAVQIEKARAQKELAKRELARVDAISDFYKLQLSDIEKQINRLQALIDVNYAKHNNGQAELDEIKLEKLRAKQAQIYNKISALETKADRLSYKSDCWNLI